MKCEVNCIIYLIILFENLSNENIMFLMSWSDVYLPDEEYSNQTSPAPVTKYNRDSVDGTCTLDNKANSAQSITDDIGDITR